MNIYNHNHHNETLAREHMQRLYDTKDKEVLKSRIETNIQTWELEYTPVKKLPMNHQTLNWAKKILNQYKIISFFNYSSTENRKLAYTFIKQLLFFNIPPSSIKMVNFDLAVLSIRGIAEDREIKESIFSEKNKVLVINNVADKKDTDIQTNYEAFWSELTTFAVLHPEIIIVLIGTEGSEVIMNKKVGALLNNNPLFLNFGKPKNQQKKIKKNITSLIKPTKEEVENIKKRKRISTATLKEKE